MPSTVVDDYALVADIPALAGKAPLPDRVPASGSR